MIICILIICNIYFVLTIIEFIADLMGATDFFSHDLALIPFSQIPLSFQTSPTPIKTIVDSVLNENKDDEEIDKSVLDENSMVQPVTPQKVLLTSTNPASPKTVHF